MAADISLNSSNQTNNSDTNNPNKRRRLNTNEETIEKCLNNGIFLNKPNNFTF